MTKVKFPYQKIFFNKRNDEGNLEEIDWTDWSLKLSANELSSLTVQLRNPDEWIDMLASSETGLKCDVGDEVGLWATYGNEAGDMIKRFGGYIQNINPTFDGSPSLKFEVKDWRYALKNQTIFKKYYKVLPVSLGQYSDYVKKLYTRNTLTEVVKDICGLCGFDDFSKMGNPYLMQKNGSEFTGDYETYYTDDWEDNKYTGRTLPYRNWTNRVGTTAIESGTPISGSYSIKHTSNGSNNTANMCYLTDTVTNYDVSFDLYIKSHSNSGYAPYVHIWYPRYIDDKNWLRVDMFYDSGASNLMKLRFLKRYKNVTTTIASQVIRPSGRIAAGSLLRFRIQDTGSYMKVWMTDVNYEGEIPRLWISTAYSVPIVANIKGFGANDTATAAIEVDNFVLKKFGGLTKTTGESSFSALVNYLGTGNGAYQMTWAPDQAAAFTLYDDATGYDLSTYPNIVLAYVHPKTCNAKYGFRVTINGSVYLIPWWSSLTSRAGEGSFLKGQPTTYTTSFGTLNIRLAEMMNELYPSTQYTVTKVELISGGETTGGTDYIDNIGIVDSKETLPVMEDYSFMDALTLVNKYASLCDHYFEIDPWKKPSITPLDHFISEYYIMEGVNLISADANYDDGNLINNKIVISKLSDVKALLGQSVNLSSIDRHGQYDNIEESDDYKTTKDINNYSSGIIAGSSYLTPALKCVVKPEFRYIPGQIIYTYIPSLGIERSLQIIDVEYNASGNCTVGLGIPSAQWIERLKNLNDKSRIGLARGTQGLDKTSDVARESKYQLGGMSPQGRVTLTGREIVEQSINLNYDRDSEGNFKWVTEQMQNKVTSDESGITIQFPTFDQTASRNWCNYDTSEAEGGANANAAMNNGTDANYTKIPDGRKGGMCHAIQCINKGNDIRLGFRSDMISSPSYYVQGNTYTVSAYLKAPAGTVIRPVLEWTSSGSGVISVPQSHIELTTANMTDDGYYRYHITATCPAYNDIYFMWMTLYVVEDTPGLDVGDICLQVDGCMVNEGELESYRPGGFAVLLPVGIAANHEKFGAIKSVTLYYNMGTGSDLINADHIWYSDIKAGQGISKSLYYNKDVALSASSGNYSADLIPSGTAFANLDYYHLINVFRPAFHTGISRTVKITKVEIDFYGV